MQTGNKKMCDLKTGDVFVRDDFTYVAIADPYYGTVWVTKPEFINEEAEVIGHDERSPKMLRRKYTYSNGKE